MTLTVPPTSDLLTQVLDTRSLTEILAAPLSSEDQTVQSMPDASPAKWHRAHTSWFFEEFLLGPAGRVPYDETFGYLFNSYYEAVGPRHPRPQRGLVTRPGAEEISRYRAHVDAELADLVAGALDEAQAEVVALGMNHEQQHQELLVMDAKHLLGGQPFDQVYAARPLDPQAPSPALAWRRVKGGLVEVGHGGNGFAYDNEGPAHRVWLEPFEIAERTVTNEDWLTFMADDGYERPEFWLSDGWHGIGEHAWRAPEYCVSRTTSGRRGRCRERGRWRRASRYAMSRFMRRTRTPAGPGPGCPLSTSGRRPPGRWRTCAGSCSTPSVCTRAWPVRT